MQVEKQKEEKIELPSWLFFGLYNSEPSCKWNKEKQEIGERILSCLKKKAELHCWDISKIIFHNPKEGNGYWNSKIIDNEQRTAKTKKQVGNGKTCMLP